MPTTASAAADAGGAIARSADGGHPPASDVEKVGLRGDVVSVARGYARNFLLPARARRGGDEGPRCRAAKRDSQRARHEAKTADEASAIADKLAKTELRFEVKAGPTGSLFGSVTPTDIADQLWRDAKIRVDRRKIGIDNIKRIGRYTVPIDLFQDVQVEVKLLVVPEGGELPSEAELAAMEAARAAGGKAGGSVHEGPPIEELLAEEEPRPPSPRRPRRSGRPRRRTEPEPEWRPDADGGARASGERKTGAARRPSSLTALVPHRLSRTVESAEIPAAERAICPQLAPSDAPATWTFPCKWRKKTCSQPTCHQVAVGPI